MSLTIKTLINPLNAELNPIRHLLALVGARHVVHVSMVIVNLTHAVRFLRILRTESKSIVIDVLPVAIFTIDRVRNAQLFLQPRLSQFGLNFFA